MGKTGRSCSSRKGKAEGARPIQISRALDIISRAHSDGVDTPQIVPVQVTADKIKMGIQRVQGPIIRVRTGGQKDRALFLGA